MSIIYLARQRRYIPFAWIIARSSDLRIEPKLLKPKPLNVATHRFLSRWGFEVSKMWHYVYILSCANGDLYTGYTTDTERRLGLHNLGVASKFTRSRLPVKIVHKEKYRSKSKALKREIEIKKLKRDEKLKLCGLS